MRHTVIASFIVLSACSTPTQDVRLAPVQPVIPVLVQKTALDREAEARTKALAPEDLYDLLSQSVWLVVAAPMDKGEPRFDRAARGSAVAISPHRLLTNCHVVSEGEIIGIGHEQDVRLAEVISEHRGDVCVITTEKVLPNYVRTFRTSDDIRVGEKAFTLGNPQGLILSLAEGLVSGKRTLENGQWVQTTAPISPGSSGGGLFDAAGNLIGITTFLHKGGQQLNFASPIKMEYVPELLAQGGQQRVRKGNVASSPNRASPSVKDLAVAAQGPSSSSDGSEFEVHTFEE